MSIRILAVSNSSTELSFFKDTLNGYTVLSARNGKEAMRQINSAYDIDIIILDAHLPDRYAFDILQFIKSDNRYGNLRTVIISKDDKTENDIKELNLNFADYLRKPVRAESLKLIVDMYLYHIKYEKLKKIIKKQYLLFDSVFMQAPVGIAIYQSNEPFDHNGNALVRLNPMYEQITGRKQHEYMNSGWTQYTHPDDIEEDMRHFKKLQAGEIKSYSMEKRYIRPDESVVWVKMIVAALDLISDHKYNYMCLIQDITKEKIIEAELLESERSKSVLLSHLPGMTYRCNYDPEWTMQYVSLGCYDLTGYRPESLLFNRDLSFNDLIAPEYRKPLWDEWKRILANRMPFKYEYEIITESGERKWVIEMGQGIYDEQGGVEALEGIILDISDRKEFENKLKYNSEHDRWTGLYNRAYLEDLLQKDADKKLRKRAVISINLSPIQSLTTSYGFHYTQDLIKKIADTLKTYCSDQCLLFNTYENRFVFYIKKYKNKSELLEFCKAVANTLENILMVERVGGGIGVLEINPDNSSDVDTLLKKLLIASEKALNTYEREFAICFYDDDMEAQITRAEDIKRELAKAASDEDDGGLFLLYQPILDLKQNRICAFEALARLKSDKLGIVPPLEFIPIAERTKLIIPLGYKIIKKSLAFLNRLKASGYGSVGVSINVSVIQLLNNDFLENLFKIIADMGANPENICIEITESVFASNYQEINNIIGHLQETRLHIAIDDFGTGYSSLARERELQVNCLKIDKHFIDKLLITKPEKAITGDIISMAHKLGHCAIAEGVEHKKQLKDLQSFCCDKIQGYLIGRPLDEGAAIALLEKTIPNAPV